MEQITVAGAAAPVPASPVAAKVLAERLEETRSTRGAEAAEHLEQLVGARIASLLEGGMHSIDLATMRSIVNYVELPAEEEPTGFGKTMQDMKDKLSQRGGMRNLG